MKLHRLSPEVERLIIVTKEGEELVEVEDCIAEVIPAWKFLLRLSAK